MLSLLKTDQIAEVKANVGARTVAQKVKLPASHIESWMFHF